MNRARNSSRVVKSSKPLASTDWAPAGSVSATSVTVSPASRSTQTGAAGSGTSRVKSVRVNDGTVCCQPPVRCPVGNSGCSSLTDPTVTALTESTRAADRS